MKNVHNGLGVKSMFDLILKEFAVFIKQKTLQKSKLLHIKWLKKRFFKKYDNLSKMN